jgi:hypothetical protein
MPSENVAPIGSMLAADPDFADLVVEFVEGMPT